MANALPMPQTANWYQPSTDQGSLVPSPLYNDQCSNYNSSQWTNRETYGSQILDGNTNLSNTTNFHQVSDLTSQVDQSQLHSGVSVDLQDRELWDKFSKAQTEMIVTKTGRRMFPGYRIKLEALNPNAQYCVLMDVVSVDQHRYKFQQGEWVVAGRGEPQVPQRFYLHPNSPCSGAKWMKDIVTFHKVKLTNSCGNSANGKFFVHSMHQYQIRIHVVRTDDVSSLHLQPMSTFEFPQTKFITVTAYQNHEVTKLKIENNPFARGFRSNGGKTKNFELASASESSLYENNKRVTMSAAFQQIHKRWKTDVTEAPVITSQASWAPYQPHKQLTMAANGFGYSNYCQNLMPLNEVNSNLMPTYYQPQSSPNSIYQPQQSPSNQISNIFQPTQVSSADQQQSMLYHPQVFDRLQASPNQYSNSGDFVPTSFSEQVTRQPLLEDNNQYQNDVYQNQFSTSQHSNFIALSAADQTTGIGYQPTSATYTSNFDQWATNGTYSTLSEFDQQQSAPENNTSDASHCIQNAGQQFYIPQAATEQIFSPPVSSPLSSHDSNAPVDILNGVSQVAQLNTCENTQSYSSPEATSNDEGYSSTSVANQELETANADNGFVSSTGDNFTSENSLDFRQGTANVEGFTAINTETCQGLVDGQIQCNAQFNTEKDNPFLQWSHNSNFSEDANLLKNNSTEC